MLENLDEREITICLLLTTNDINGHTINYYQSHTKINDLKQLNNLLAKSFDKNENTLVFTIYGNQNQRRYIGIKLK